MQTSDTPREHWNLYYILQIDQQQHPMPQEAVQRIQQKLVQILREGKTGKGCEKE